MAGAWNKGMSSVTVKNECSTAPYIPKVQENVSSLGDQHPTNADRKSRMFVHIGVMSA
jgi:hypothetical protein